MISMLGGGSCQSFAARRFLLVVELFAHEPRRIKVKTYTGIWRAPFMSVAMVSLLVVISPVNAQESSNSDPPQATTVSDAEIPVDNLHVSLRPLTKDELEIELRGWFDLLRAKIREVGETELKLIALADDESDDELRERILVLRNEETAITERARTVLDALKAKGGDVQTAEQFIAAISDISETTDTTSYRAAVIAEFTNWAKRDDGGMLWVRRSLLALIILFVFWLMSKFAGRITAKAMSRHLSTSNLLENFARRTTGGVVFVVGILMALAVLGVPIGPLMAALGAGGFIVGFALQDTLGNFASGLMIMVYRPFDVDDYIAVAGGEGTVKEMSLVSTTLLTVDNKVLIIPNKKAWSDTIVNFTGRDIRRVDLVFGIGYDDNIRHATDVLMEVAGEHKLVLDEPPVMVNVDELADSSVNLLCRPWVKTKDYWAVRWDLTRQVKERFDAEGISFPFPQRDVHMHPESVST
jgi:small conductance mechanosensitive channel